MQIHPITIEESGEYGEEKVHINGHHQREYDHRQRAHKLVHILVCDYCEWRWIEELVVVLMDIPENGVSMTDPVIRIFVQICEKEYDNCLNQKWLRDNILI